MKLSPQEKAARRAAFHAMSPAEKREYIWEYYKAPLLLGLLLLIGLGSILQRQLTKKEPVLYLALVNTSVGEDLEDSLTVDFLHVAGFDERRQEVYLYQGLYLSDNADTLNHEYAYASKMKLTGALNAKKLDLVLMNREGYDLLSQKGYLLDLSALLSGQDPALQTSLSPYLTANEVVTADNSLDVMLGNAVEERRLTETVSNALAVSPMPLFLNAGFDGELFLGVVANSSRIDAVLLFFRYLL